MAIRRKPLRDSSISAGERPPASSRLWPSAFGQQILQLERPLLAQLVRRLHGDAVLWVGEDAPTALGLKRSMVRAGFFLRQSEQGPDLAHSELPVLKAQVDELPFQSRTLDGVVLHHALERVGDPRTALREVARVLAPGGRLLICGFNPWSLYGARRVYAKLFPDLFSDNRFVNPLRLFDWLTLLGLELESEPFYTDFRAPVGQRRSMLEMQEKSLRRLTHPGVWRPPFGGLLVVSAVKQASAMRPHWRTSAKDARRLAPVAYPRVASWQRVRDEA